MLLRLSITERRESHCGCFATQTLSSMVAPLISLQSQASTIKISHIFILSNFDFHVSDESYKLKLNCSQTRIKWKWRYKQEAGGNSSLFHQCLQKYCQMGVSCWHFQQHSHILKPLNRANSSLDTTGLSEEICVEEKCQKTRNMGPAIGMLLLQAEFVLLRFLDKV